MRLGALGRGLGLGCAGLGLSIGCRLVVVGVVVPGRGGQFAIVAGVCE